MIYKSKEELLFKSSIQIENKNLKIIDQDLFKEDVVENLVETIVKSDSIPLREFCYGVVKAAAKEFGIFPSSIQIFMRRERGRG